MLTELNGKFLILARGIQAIAGLEISADIGTFKRGLLFACQSVVWQEDVDSEDVALAGKEEGCAQCEILVRYICPVPCNASIPIKIRNGKGNMCFLLHRH